MYGQGYGPPPPPQQYRPPQPYRPVLVAQPGGFPGYIPPNSRTTPRYPYQPTKPPVQDAEQRFMQYAGRSQTVDSEQLQEVLGDSGFSSAFKSKFSLETCRIMIAMLDRNHDGVMGIDEFRELLSALGHWRLTFDKYDQDKSGTIEPNEVHDLIKGMGYKLDDKMLTTLTNRYSRKAMGQHKIFFDDFVAMCVRLRAFSEAFKQRDTNQDGNASFEYGDFLQMTLIL